MVKLARTAGLAVALCALMAAPAQAAFFPEFSVELEPPVAGGTPAVTMAISQPAADTAIERFTLTLPQGFRLAGAPAAPAGTQIGVFAAGLGAGAPVVGKVTKTSATSFELNLSMLGGAVSQTVEGKLVERATGALDLRLDQLPALPLTTLALRLWGGAYSLVRAPEQCGTYALDGKFTSRAGELAIDRTLVPVAGCDDAPLVQVANVSLTKTRFKSGGSLYGTRTIIAWWASQATDHTDVLVERRKEGTWRDVGSFVATGNEGENTVRWDGRLKGRALKPGRYGLRIQPAGSDAAKRVRFRIVK